MAMKNIAARWRLIGTCLAEGTWTEAMAGIEGEKGIGKEIGSDDHLGYACIFFSFFFSSLFQAKRGQRKEPGSKS
jgi:hypothetical protein